MQPVRRFHCLKWLFSWKLELNLFNLIKTSGNKFYKRRSSGSVWQQQINIWENTKKTVFVGLLPMIPPACRLPFTRLCIFLVSESASFLRSVATHVYSSIVASWARRGGGVWRGGTCSDRQTCVEPATKGKTLRAPLVGGMLIKEGRKMRLPL